MATGRQRLQAAQAELGAAGVPDASEALAALQSAMAQAFEYRGVSEGGGAAAGTTAGGFRAPDARPALFQRAEYDEAGNKLQRATPFRNFFQTAARAIAPNWETPRDVRERRAQEEADRLDRQVVEAARGVRDEFIGGSIERLAGAATTKEQLAQIDQFQAAYAYAREHEDSPDPGMRARAQEFLGAAPDAAKTLLDGFVNRSQAQDDMAFARHQKELSENVRPQLNVHRGVLEANHARYGAAVDIWNAAPTATMQREAFETFMRGMFPDSPAADVLKAIGLGAIGKYASYLDVPPEAMPGIMEVALRASNEMNIAAHDALAAEAATLYELQRRLNPSMEERDTVIARPWSAPEPPKFGPVKPLLALPAASGGGAPPLSPPQGGPTIMQGIRSMWDVELRQRPDESQEQYFERMRRERRPTDD